MGPDRKINKNGQETGMTPLSGTEFLQDVRRYLVSQSELYGDELYTGDILVQTSGTSDPESLNKFRENIENCMQCALSKTRRNFVFGCGNAGANLMLIGEAPGEDEDKKGEPFVGKAGQLLDKILDSIAFTRDEVFIGNILKCRPPNNRDPQPEEVELCLPYLMSQIKIIKPVLILALGRIAAQTLLKTTASLGQLRGKIHTFGDASLIVTYHPAALLRNPQWKRAVWEDVQMLRKHYDQTVGDKPKWNPPKR